MNVYDVLVLARCCALLPPPASEPSPYYSERDVPGFLLVEHSDHHKSALQCRFLRSQAVRLLAAHACTLGEARRELTTLIYCKRTHARA